MYPSDAVAIDTIDFLEDEKNLPPGGFLQAEPEDFRPRRQAANFLEAAAAVRDAKMDLLMVGDRHAVSINAFSPIPLIARLMGVTGELPLACLFLAPFYNPIVLAEQIGTLSVLSSGPFTAAFAIGDTEAQFAAFNMALKSRTVRTDEVIEIVRRLLAGEKVSFDGRYHRLVDVSIGPLPDTPVPIWVGGRRGGAVDRAGKLGDAWISDTRATDEELAGELAHYRRVADEFGRPVKAVLRRNIFVGETDADADNVVSRILQSSYRGLTPERVLSGGPDRVAEELLRYEAMGFDLAIVRHLAGDHDLMLSSVRRIGDAVMPLLGRHG